jgi:hypothetical protein
MIVMLRIEKELISLFQIHALPSLIKRKGQRKSFRIGFLFLTTSLKEKEEMRERIEKNRGWQ